MPYVDATQQLVFEVYVSDLQRSLQFYRRLGFEVLTDRGDFATLAWEGHYLFMIVRDGRPTAAAENAAQGNLRIMAPNVDHLWSLALAMNARVVQSINNRSYGTRDFTIADPDGFHLRFATSLSDLADQAIH